MALVIPETALRYRGEEIYVETVLRESEPRVVEKTVEIGIVDGLVRLSVGIEDVADQIADLERALD